MKSGIPTLLEFEIERKRKEEGFKAFLKMLRYKYELEEWAASLRDQAKQNPRERKDYPVLISGEDDRGHKVVEQGTLSDAYSWPEKQLALVHAEMERREVEEKLTQKDEAAKKWKIAKALAFNKANKFLKEHPRVKTVPMPLMREIVEHVYPELNDKSMTKKANTLRSQTQRSLKQYLKTRTRRAVRNL